MYFKSKYFLFTTILIVNILTAVCQVPRFGCQGILNGYCFRHIRTTGGPNEEKTWQESQNICEEDNYTLATIRNVEEHKLVLTIIPGSRCWIGLNDIRNLGRYVWADGSLSAFQLFNSATTAVIDGECVETKYSNSERWNYDSCNTNKKCYICGGDIIQFGTVTNGVHTALSNNAILFTDEVLFCVTETNTEVIWTFATDSYAPFSTTLEATSWDPATGLSTLSVNTRDQGFYRCRVTQNAGDFVFFTAGVFDMNKTIVASDGSSYNYTIGLDRENIEILCDLSPTIPLANIRWRVDSIVYTNPLNIFVNRDTLPTNQNVLECFDITADDVVLLTASLNLQGAPTISLTYSGRQNQIHSQIAPNLNSISLPLPAQTLTLSSSLSMGTWRLLGGEDFTESVLVINDLYETYDEIFQFYTFNCDNEEVLATQIRITTTGIADYCDAIYEGSCITFHIVDTGLTWAESEMNCLTFNGHLASIASAIESDIFTNISNTTDRRCWIGLNDRDIEAGLDGDQFSWIDGSNSTYRNFFDFEPTNNLPQEDGTYLQTFTDDIGWINVNGSITYDCYFCKKATSLFGRVLPPNGSIVLNNATYFTESVILICVNENNLTTRWTYSEGSLSNTTDVTSNATQTVNGLSQLTVSDSGFYRCEISMGGIPLTFLAGVFNFSRLIVALPTVNYTYIVGIDTFEAILYCNTTANASLHNTAWRRQGINATNLSNPLNIRENGVELVDTDPTLLCTHLLDGMILLTASVLVQGPPITIVSNNINSLSLLPPNQNQLPLDVLTRKLVLSSNIQNVEWVLPNGVTIQQNSVEISVVRIEDNGVYSLYSEQTWDQTRTLLMMVNLVVQNFFIQRISKLTSTQIDNTAILLEWELVETPIPLSEEYFRIYSVNDVSEQLIGETSQLSYNITGLALNVQYTFIVELEYAFTAVRSRNFTDIQLTNITPTTTSELIIEILPFLIPIIAAIVIVALIICCLMFSCIVYCCSIKKGNQGIDSIRLENITETYHNDHLNGIVPNIDRNIIINRVETDIETSQGSGSYATIEPHYDRITPIYDRMEPANKRDSGNYQEIEEIVDPIMRPIPLEQYKSQLDRIWENEGELEGEYEQLGGKTLRYACDNALVVYNKHKNKYKQVYPYDKSRVILSQYGSEGPRSDYINASLIPGVYVPNSFIAAQAPKDTTIEDFWKMIIENNIVNIVMLTKLIENGKQKCERYFPTDEYNILQIGVYNIALKSETVDIGFTVRIFTVTDSVHSFDVKHFHYTAWPDHDVPTQFDELLSFVRKVHEGISRTRSPILVHCSAGVGRTGTFMTLFNLAKAIQKGRAISIYRIVYEMREHRPQMVQTFRQYKFIYLAVLEMLFGQTSIQAKDFTNTYKLYLKSDIDGYISAFLKQFSELNYQCEKAFQETCSIAKDPKHKNKNHLKFSLPYDKNRVLLYSEHFETDYINATYLESSNMIITLNPTVFSLQDFLQMVYQFKASLIVTLTTYTEKMLIESGQSEFIQYWPTSSGPGKCAPFILTMTKCDNWQAIDKKVITLTHTLDSSMHTFTQIISTKWSSSDEPTDICAIVKLLKAINSHKSDHPNSPIIIHCSDGIAKTGILYTLFKAIQESIGRNEVDIFQIIKKLRSERMNSIPELNHYLSCFALMNEYYCDTAIL
ncbi:Receptor-type tyrosine-protein phosphatase alpha isoform X4 [Oopsacas minuta]|uniref:protein-tyrosine-phosphatase n=1 Tax=Oopsacas minuta TaxID=111878 RepID=A0AAV7JNE2_9METZ|nr:Receptor-type tyrosine-protein phosphatase alpha isoform X4 [Oopsacas minuta]